MAKASLAPALAGTMLAPMELLAAALQGACFLVAAAALCYAPLWRLAALLLLGTAIFCAYLGVTGPEERELVTQHTFVGYEGIELEPSAVHHATGTERAPGWQWPLPFLGVAVLWTVLLAARRNRDPDGDEENPWLLPLLLGWTATACWIGMQKLAAPSELVHPFALERFLWPAGLALSLRIAAVTKKLLPLLLLLALGATLLRLPAAVFSKYASDQHLGTSLDISSITQLVHPIQRVQLEVTSGSSEQQFWLIWAEHVLAYPAFHCMSYFGFAFAIWLLHRQSGPSA